MSIAEIWAYTSKNTGTHLDKTAEQDEEYQMLKGLSSKDSVAIAINYQKYVENTGMSGNTSP